MGRNQHQQSVFPSSPPTKYLTMKVEMNGHPEKVPFISGPLGGPPSSYRARLKLLVAVSWVLVILAVYNVCMPSAMFLPSSDSAPSSSGPGRPTASPSTDAIAPFSLARLPLRPSAPADPYTYITLLCDELMLDGLLVLAQSLRAVNSSHGLVVMLLPEVASKLRPILADPAFNVQEVLEIEELPYPFAVTEKMVKENKACRYSKLNLWSQTRFKKVVFLDADLLIVKNIDNLFERDEMSAAMDLAGTFNTGVFVAEPNATTYADMLSVYPKAPSYNKGDQGFLNYYFTEYLKEKSVHSLPTEYNVPSKLQEYAIWEKIRRQAKVFHLTSATKPWNFFRATDKHWSRNLEPDVFYQWVKARRTLDSTTLGPHYRDQMLEPHFNSSLALASSVNAVWKNHHRAAAVCDAHPWEKMKVQDKFTVAIATWDRVDLLMALIEHYASIPEVDLIVVTWHNPAVTPPVSLASRAVATFFDTDVVNRKTFWAARKAEEDARQEQHARGRRNIPATKAGPPVIVVRQSTNSLNNRFNPHAVIRTEAVYVADDDVRVSPHLISSAFAEHRSRPTQLVGFWPRGHAPVSNPSADAATTTYTPPAYTYFIPKSLKDDPSTNYSMVLTKGMFAPSQLLHAYTCLIPQAIHSYVDAHMNCEDVAFNMLASGMTGLGPRAVYYAGDAGGAGGIEDFGGTGGISSSATHAGRRSMCLGDLAMLFGRMTLVEGRLQTAVFERPARFVKKTPGEVGAVGGGAASV
ncbi:Exostoses (Multiple)-like 3 [Irineochytrium annulatum]|nr:Exostoses (Multiple)-like 3 [Irineochytrium annulatum]